MKDHTEQYEEFNEYLRIGLFVGTILLACTLTHTCSIGRDGGRNRRPNSRRRRMMKQNGQ